ncbi:MAG: DUF971 domain-containing protein [Alphaproteobacteria bacterium]|nr:DUF971 domain-containing protein [Alphaproteobacteria bacterium]
MTAPWPRELKVSAARDLLTIEFDNGETVRLSAEYLRVESPSAEVQGHGPSQRTTVGGKRAVRIENLEPVGNYAVRILFSDGHDSGLYSWDWLYRLAREHDRLWPAYLSALTAKGLSRDEPGGRT